MYESSDRDHISHLGLRTNTNAIPLGSTDLAEYPSRATNTGTDQRSGVHLLQAIINKINGTCEIADTQAAAVCLELPCVETSCHTTYVFIHAAIAVVTERLDTDAGHDNPENNKQKIKRRSCTRGLA